MAEAQNTVIDGRHIRIEQARVNRTLFILRFGRNTTEQVALDQCPHVLPASCWLPHGLTITRDDFLS